MNIIKAKKEPVIRPQLKMKVFHEDIYKGRELMTVVGIRERQVELRGDYSGGTHNDISDSWFPIEGLFRLRKVCDQVVKHGSCQLHNLHCGSPDCEPYLSNWGNYIEGVLENKVELYA